MSEEDITQYSLILYRDDEDTKPKSASKTEGCAKGTGGHVVSLTCMVSCHGRVPLILIESLSKNDGRIWSRDSFGSVPDVHPYNKDDSNYVCNSRVNLVVPSNESTGLGFLVCVYV